MFRRVKKTQSDTLKFQNWIDPDSRGAEKLWHPVMIDKLESFGMRNKWRVMKGWEWGVNVSDI